MFPVSSNASFSSNSTYSYKSENVENQCKTAVSHDTPQLKKLSVKISERNFKVPNTSDSVVAYEYLEKGCHSNGSKTSDLITRSNYGRIGLGKSSSGTIRPVQDVPSWIRTIKLSPDVHSYNALTELTEDKKVRLRLSNDIRTGEEVIMWFSEEVALLMNIPFLTPVNIVDNKCYRCHVCKISFETPNPLKIHLAVSCGQQSIDILWKRLYYNTANARGEAPEYRHLESVPGHVVNYHFTQSTFLPVSPRGSFSYLPLAHLPQEQPATDQIISAASQIETIVSNMGNTKQGHLCIYCGKVYSRKYGLKIHIRTHTGFKPLKCKFCFRPFGDPSNLNKHVRLHIQTGSTIFKCHFCHKIMLRRRDLKRHLQTRHHEQMVSSKTDAEGSSDDYLQ